MFPDYYKILDVPVDASAFQIKKSFRSKIKELHPDNNPLPDAKNDFTQAYEAYEILIHPNTRKLYNFDLQNGHSPETQKNCAYFIRYAHNLADEHANLKYSDLIQTKFFNYVNENGFHMHRLTVRSRYYIILHTTFCIYN